MLCQIPQCNRPHAAKGLCKLHYDRLRTTGDMGSVDSLRRMEHSDICEVEGCDRPYLARGYCVLHYSRWKKTGQPQELGPPSKRGGTIGTIREGYRIFKRKGK